MAQPETERYLELLKLPSLQSVQDEIVERVNEKLLKFDCWKTPIRLTKVAREFQIRPIPTIQARNRKAGIAFDRDSGEFVISLVSESVAETEQAAAPDGQLELSLEKRTQRFTYAHEFAHRFLFVKDGNYFKRALAIVADECESASRLVAIRRLSGIEEKLCNEVAGRILVPHTMLESHIASYIKARQDDDPASNDHLVWDVIRTVAHTFQVTRWCAFRRLAAMRPSTLVSTLGAGFCFLLIGESIVTGAGHGIKRVRLRDCWWPDSIDGHLLKHAYPGIQLEHLGAEFARGVKDAIATSFVDPRPLSCPISIRTQGAPKADRVDARFKGFLCTWSLTPISQVAAYGTISLQ